MNALLQFYPGDSVAVLVANIAVQISVVALLAATMRKNDPSWHPFRKMESL